MDISLLWVLCVVRQRSLRRADHSSRGVLPPFVCVYEYNGETSIMRRSWPSRGCCVMGVKEKILEKGRRLTFIREIFLWN
jgi:hypothetical protein